MEKNGRREEIYNKRSASCFRSGFIQPYMGFIEERNRSPEEDVVLINAAHASLYHWSRIGTPENIQNGHWMCSHVYTILNRHESSLYHAIKCVELTEKKHY
jgi:hypothetical protein